jgi:ABC-type branched-subunit amino acid transport system ATPase component
MAAFAMSISATAISIGSIVPARMRVHASAISNIALYGAGGLLGQFFLAGVYGRSGPTAAIIALSVPGVLAGVTLYSAHRTINPDLDGLLDDIIEDEELDSFVESGRRLPMLACRHVDFFYGSVQTLFGVSFSVDAGEMVCLLGTNGAGKSTLLKVISGHLLPTRGSVRLRGTDVTYVEAPRRTKLGVQYIAGGHGTFGQLTVVENLRAFGYTRGRRRSAIEAGIEETFAAFPRLAERRNQRASTLSGGENQMLALGRAFILKPELLIIDELSLGLAPKLVGELLETVRRINASGTSVVRVEQSVNIALSLVDHAYFMEKGQMRFDGSASELRQRDDLLRSVFLRGATETVVSD